MIDFLNKKLSIQHAAILTLSFLLLSGCSDSGPDTEAYNCTQTCLQSAPTLSTNTVSTTTGDTVDVTLNFAGDAANIQRVDITLRDVNSGSNAGTSVTFSPISSILTESIIVNSGTSTGTYYPHVTIFMTASNTNNRYYRDSSVSTSQYTFYEIEDGSAQFLMIAPFSIPYLTVN